MTQNEPCPFCGCTESGLEGGGGGVFWVVCGGCTTTGPSGPTKAEAVERWNTRHNRRAACGPKQLDRRQSIAAQRAIASEVIDCDRGGSELDVIAEKAGVSRSTIYRWVRRERRRR